MSQQHSFSRVLITLIAAWAFSTACSSPHPPSPPPAATAASSYGIEIPVGTERAEARAWDAQYPVGVGVVFVTGVDGGFFEPVDGIYSRTAEALSLSGISSVFVKYRNPGNLDSSVEDALAALQFLRDRGAKRFALMGWSFGGAVIIHSAYRSPDVAALIGLASQSEHSEPIMGLGNRALLLVHPREDENVPFSSSEQILEQAPDEMRRQLIPLENTDHAMTGAADRVDPVVQAWLSNELIAPRSAL